MGGGAGAGDPYDGIVFRRTFIRWLVTGISAAVTVTFGLVVAEILADDPPLWFAVLLVALVAGLVAYTVRCPRQGIWADGEGVTVRNAFTGHRLRWEDVEEIEEPSGYRAGSPAMAGIGFVRRDGLRVDAALFSPGRFGVGAAHPAAVVDALRRQQRLGLEARATSEADVAALPLVSDSPTFSVALRGYDRRHVEQTVAQIRSAPPGTVAVPEFMIVLRGYNRSEVDAYMRQHGAPG